jgi:hypothetical protein
MTNKFNEAANSWMRKLDPSNPIDQKITRIGNMDLYDYHPHDPEQVRFEDPNHELNWYKNRVKEWAGDKPTTDSMMKALDKAWTGTHPRFHYEALHLELLRTRGKGNKKRKFKDQGYYPENDKFDPQYMKDWLQKEIMGEFMVKRDGAMPFHTAR